MTSNVIDNDIITSNVIDNDIITSNVFDNDIKSIKRNSRWRFMFFFIY